MKILAIDTSTSACSVALSIDSILFSSHLIAPMQQTKLILPTINKLLEDARLQLNQLDALAFGCGPGSFTGIRIATSVIQGLAFATQLPIISISSLAALAQIAFLTTHHSAYLVAMDARIQEVYWGEYHLNETGLMQLHQSENLTKPQEILINSKKIVGLGSAWRNYKKIIPYHPEIIDFENLPLAQGIIPLAIDKFLKKEQLRPHEAHPSYLRNEVAKKNSL